MPLTGMHVFVVEDEALVLLSLEDMLADIGCIVAGAAVRLDDARAKAATLTFDLALLDVNIAGERIDPVAAILAQRGIPFLFLSGYERSSLPPDFRDRPLLAKPYGRSGLEHAMRGCLPAERAP